MKTGTVIFGGIVFILVGLAFCAAGAYLARPSSAQRQPVSKSAGIIFYIIGAMTLVFGILALCFFRQISRQVLRTACFIYLVALVILLAVFCAMVKEKK